MNQNATYNASQLMRYPHFNMHIYLFQYINNERKRGIMPINVKIHVSTDHGMIPLFRFGRKQLELLTFEIDLFEKQPFEQHIV